MIWVSVTVCLFFCFLLVILLGWYNIGALSLLDSIKCIYFISCLTMALRHRKVDKVSHQSSINCTENIIPITPIY